MGKLSLFVGSGDLIMVGRGWMWVVAVKNDWLWVVVGGGGEIMVGRGWWLRNFAWSWVVAGGGGKIIAGSKWLHDFVMPLFQKHAEPVFLTMLSLSRWNLLNSGNVVFTIDIVFQNLNGYFSWLMVFRSFHMVSNRYLYILISSGYRLPLVRTCGCSHGPEFVFPGATPSLFSLN